MPRTSKNSTSGKPSRGKLGGLGTRPLGTGKSVRGTPARQTNALKKIFQVGGSGGANTANFKSRGVKIGGGGGGGNLGK